MATQTIAKTGKTVKLKESTSEFTARLREKVQAREVVRKIRSKGGSARAETLPSGRTVVVQVKAPEVFEARTSGGTLFAKGTMQDIREATRRKEQATRAQIQARAREAEKKRVKLEFVRGVSPKTERVLTAISKAREDEPVSIPRRKKEGIILERVTNVKPSDFDLRTFSDLKNKGIDKTVALSVAKSKRKKQTEAIKKVQAVNKKVEGFNKNYERSVNKLIDTVNKIGFAPKIKNKSFQDSVERQTMIKISKFINPFIIGTEIGAGLSNFVTLREAGIIDPKKFFNKILSGAGSGVNFVFTNNPKTTINTVKRNTLEFSTRAVNSLKKNLNPNTVDGLSNILTLAFFVRPDKLLVGASKRTVNIVKRVASHPPTRRVLATAVRAPAFSVVGVAGGKGVKFKGKPLSKASKKAISRGQTKKIGREIKTKSQARKARKELARVETKKMEKLLVLARDLKASRVETFTKTTKFKYKPDVKSTFIRETVLGKGKAKNRVTTVKVKSGVVPKRVIDLNVRNVVNKANFTKQVRASGKTGQVLLTKTQNKRLKININKNLKKSKNPKAIKKVLAVNKRNERFIPTSDKVSVDMRPEQLFPDLIQPATQTATKGFRSAKIKDSLMKSLQAQKKSLEKASREKFDKLFKSIDSQIISKYKTADSRALSKGLFLVELQKVPKPNLSFLASLTNKSFAGNVNNALRALSLLNFKVGVVSNVIKIVSQTPVSKSKVVGKVISVKKISPKKPVTKPKRLRKPRRVRVVPKVKKPVKKPLTRVIRKVKKPVKIKTIRKLPKKLPFRVKLFRTKKEVVSFIKRIVKQKPRGFQPSLVAVLKGLRGKKPKNITGAEIRFIIEEEVKKIKKKKGVKRLPRKK